MTQPTWGLEASHYRFINIVGSGSFSKVYRAESLHDKTQVAIKVMDLDNVSTSFEDILQVTILIYYIIVTTYKSHIHIHIHTHIILLLLSKSGGTNNETIFQSKYFTMSL